MLKTNDMTLASLVQNSVRAGDLKWPVQHAEPLGIITIEDVIEELLQQVHAPFLKGIGPAPNPFAKFGSLE